MKRGKRTILHALAILMASAMAASLQSCATTSHSMPTATRLVELGIVEADSDLASLKRGRTMAIMDCRECHRQYWPQEFSAKRWPRLARNMGRLASMNQDQIDDLMEYMIAASKTAPGDSVDRSSRTQARHGVSQNATANGAGQ